MTLISNKSLVYVKVPKGEPIPDQDIKVEDGSFDLDAALPEGGFTAQVLYGSFDPYLRKLMHTKAISKDCPPMKTGSTIMNDAILQVLRSDKAAKFHPGDILIGYVAIQEYLLVSADEGKGLKIIDNPFNLDLKVFLGALGMPGLTAFSAFYEIGKPKKGETIFISAASGAVGQVVGQLAKHEGLRVIGSVGSDEKLKVLMDVLKFDGGFNYKQGTIQEELTKLAPDGIDIYFDNVGGEQLEAAIDSLKSDGRIIACGFASQYNIPTKKQYGIRNTGLVVGKRLTWRGLTTGEEEAGFAAKYAEEHQKNVQKWLVDGSFNTVMNVTYGMHNAAFGLAELFRGDNVGKAILDVKGSKIQ